MTRRYNFDDIVKFNEEHPRFTVFLRQNNVNRNFALAWERGVTCGKIRQNRVKETDCGVSMSTDTEMEPIEQEPDDADYMDCLIRQNGVTPFIAYLKAALTAVCNVDFSIRHLVHLDKMNKNQRNMTTVAVKAHLVRGFEKRFDWLMQDVCNLDFDGQIKLRRKDMDKLVKTHELFLELKEDPTLAVEKNLSNYDLNRPFFSYFTISAGIVTVLVSDKFRINNNNLNSMWEDRDSTEGLDTFFGEGGDVIKYLYSTYNEVTQYIVNRKRLAVAQGKTVMKRSDEKYEEWSKDPVLKDKIYVDMQPAFQPLESHDFELPMIESCRQRCVAYAALAETMKLSEQLLNVTDALWKAAQQGQKPTRSTW